MSLVSVAYVDTSTLAALALDEAAAGNLSRRLVEYNRLLSSNLLEAELRSVFAREAWRFDERTLAGIDWIFPDRPLTQEFAAVLAKGYLRGADLWHVAAALYVSPQPGDIAFITLDQRQGAVAAALGFTTVPRVPPH